MVDGGRRRLAERSDSGGLNGGNIRVVERGSWSVCGGKGDGRERGCCTRGGMEGRCCDGSEAGMVVK